MKKLILMFTCALFCVCNATAQELQVQSLKLDPTDVTASTERRADSDGKACALIKLQTTAKIANIKGNTVGDVVDQGSEKWIYVRPGTSQLTITPEDGKPISVNFADYNVSGTKSLLTYKMVISGQTSAGELKYNEGETYYLEKDYAKALKCFEESVEAGFIPAYNMLGSFYYNGLGVERNLEKAVYYTQKGADAGDLEAQISIAGMLANGQGVAQNKPLAISYYEKAALQGNVEAQISLGSMLIMSDGPERDPEKGRIWLEKAAEQNDPTAQFALGSLYFTGGGGLATDKEKAISWLQKAADQDFAQAIPMIATVYVMSGDNDKAFEYFKKGAILEDPASMAAVGTAYIYGTNGLRRDFIKGFQLVKKAEELGFPVNSVLAQCYENGWGTPKDKKLARKYQKAADEEAKGRQQKTREVLNKVR
jgi:TPR repeat protein